MSEKSMGTYWPASGYIVAMPAALKTANQSTEAMQICVFFGCTFKLSLKAFYLWTC